MNAGTPILVLISGPICSGKSTLSQTLTTSESFKMIRSSEYLRGVAREKGESLERKSLMQIGDELDEVTDYAWLVEDVAVPTVAQLPNQHRWLIDSVRKKKQIDHFRSAFPNVFHIHLTASEKVLERRFRERQENQERLEGMDYQTAISHPNEMSSRSLVDVADLVVESGADGTEVVIHRIADFERTIRSTI